jgi:hypothetical protein
MWWRGEWLSMGEVERALQKLAARKEGANHIKR